MIVSLSLPIYKHERKMIFFKPLRKKRDVVVGRKAEFVSTAKGRGKEIAKRGKKERFIG